jgi:hypothetical protein
MQFSVFLVVDMDKLYPNPDKPEQKFLDGIIAAGHRQDDKADFLSL